MDHCVPLRLEICWNRHRRRKGDPHHSYCGGKPTKNSYPCLSSAAKFATMPKHAQVRFRQKPVVERVVANGQTRTPD